MNEDRYEYVSKILKNFGWLQDFILRNTRKYIVDIFKSNKIASVLDACCGAGTLSIYLHNSGMNVTAVDASPSMLALARKKTNDINFIEADLTYFEVGWSDQYIFIVPAYEMVVAITSGYYY